MKDYEADKKVLMHILSTYNLNQSQLAERLGINKQTISFVYNGQRGFSQKVKADLNKEFGVYTGNKPGFVTPDVYEINYTPEIHLPIHSSLHDKKERFVIDKRLIPDNLDIKIPYCFIVTLATDSLSPVYLNGDRIILDTSKKTLKNDCVFAFTYKDVCYVRKVLVMPSKVKCVSSDTRDTFYIDDYKEIKVLGMVVPNVRF